MKAGTLQDGTPYLAEWQRRCAACGMWLGISRGTPGLHGSLARGFCRANRTQGYRGRRRFYACVQQPRTPHPTTGAPRWNPFVFVRPTRAQLQEIRAAFTEA